MPELDVPGLLLTLDRGTGGSAEQVASRVLPLIPLQAAALALDLGPEDRLRARVQRALDRLLAVQRVDGGFAPWSPQGEGELWLGAYVLDVLTRARAAGYRVADPPYRAGLDALKKVVDNSWSEEAELAGRAYAYHVLARAKMIDVAPLHYFQETYGAKLPTDLARAQLAGALALLGDAGRAKEVFDKLGGPRQVPAGARDYGTELRDQAGALAIAAESGVVERDRLLDLAGKLARRVGEATGLGGQEQAWLLLAAHALGERLGEKDVKLEVAGQPVEAKKPVHRRFDAAALPVTVKNTGAEPLTQVLTVTGVPADPRPAEAEGFRIARSMFDMAGKPVDPAQVRPNDVLVVILEGEALDGGAHPVLVVDPLPAGLEIENVRLADSAQLGGLSWLGGLSAARHVEFRDDRFVAAVDLTPRQPSFRLVYLARAVVPGDFEQPGAQVEDLSAPRLFARVPAGRLRIGGE